MAKKEVRRTRDAAGIGPYAREREQLVRISQMKGWTVQKGEADIRSWEVRTVSGKVLGSVRDLLVDQKAGEVVMIDVDLAGTDRHAYVPLRVVEVDRTQRVVRADSADLQEDVDEDRTRLTNDELATVRNDRVARPQLRDDLHDEIVSEPDDVRRADRAADIPAERVVERRPIVEETVVRRRDMADPDADAESRL
ncbi:MAG TPA: PRC-barrel domain-containing protein [Gemmatimonadaceae bacterium]|nr:PRC-barrel domain-containing protein [Gemmatimonadaceae bacterium]